jgi:scyllo-inositol 2-dehydrogenase (NADP+)
MHKINTALCSFGMSGRVFHAPFLEQHPGFTLYAVWERSKKNVQELYPNVISYDNYEELLEDPAIELVVVNTPTYTHYDFARAALLAGKHVIVEKAFTVTVAQAEDLVQIAKSQKLKLSVYQNRRWDSDFKTVKKIVGEKHLGTIVEAEIHFDRYNLSLSPKEHKETPGPGAGVLHDLGPHIIDQALQLFGMPDALFADIRSLRPSSQVSDYIDILLFYPSLRVRLKSSYFVKEPLPAFILHGSKGSFLKHRADIQETALQNGLKPGGNNWGQEPTSAQGILHTTGKDGDVRQEVTTLPGNYMEYYETIYEALTSNKSLPVTAEEGLSVMRIIEAAINSNTEKRVIEIG